MTTEKGFGQYLVDSGLITETQHHTALKTQNKTRLLGDLAIEFNYLHHSDIDRILDYQKENPRTRFGEAAVALGMITVNQLQYLLDVRTRRKTRIGDILIQQKYISVEALNQALMSYEKRKKRFKSVLIADPSSTVLSLIEKMLRKYGYEVTKAKSGAEAMDMALKKRPDLLITAGVLPDMEGNGLCRNIMANLGSSAMSMILLSGDDSVKNLTAAFESGITHFIKKPVSETELINVIYQLEKEIEERRPEKILVADDSVGARMIISREFSKAGYQVYMADNGRKAVEMARALMPDLITTDLEMPLMDGFDVCKALKEDPSTSDIPVVIVSASSSPDMMEKGFEVGAIEFFAKPFTTGKLASYVNVIFESRKIRKKEKILIADDSRVTLSMLKYMFEKNGYNAHTAENGWKAARIAEEIKPDLILTDCFMPVMDGFELVGELKQNPALRHIPVVMITSSKERSHIIKALSSGAVDYIIKPFDESEMLARVGAHLTNKRLMDELRRERDKMEKMKDEISMYARKMESAARTDFLTGAMNRRSFLELAEKEFARSKRYGGSLSFLMLDIDHFKRVNDTYGHEAGDKALVAVSRICQETLRSTDLFCRFGGEEFVAALVETGPDGAMQKAERLREAIFANKMDLGKGLVNISISIGVATVENADKNLDQTLARSDKAMYQAKANGRNRVEFL